MDKLCIQILFENRAVEVNEQLLGNILEFGIRSFFGIIGGSLIHYEIVRVNTRDGEIEVECEREYTEKISTALALISSYGVSRIRSKVIRINSEERGEREIDTRKLNKLFDI